MGIILKNILVSLTLCSFTACIDKEELARSSFGPKGDSSSKASPASVLSMGRDDDDGHAKKWHIGGRD